MVHRMREQGGGEAAPVLSGVRAQRGDQRGGAYLLLPSLEALPRLAITAAIAVIAAILLLALLLSLHLCHRLAGQAPDVADSQARGAQRRGDLQGKGGRRQIRMMLNAVVDEAHT